MHILRFSATEIFGVPLDSPDKPSTPEEAMSLMRDYNVIGEEVSTEIVDLTPPYIEGNDMHTFLTRRSANGEAVIHTMPAVANATSLMTAYTTYGTEFTEEVEPASFVIPEEIPAFSMTGPGPDYAGQLCLYELIVHEDAI